VYACQVQGVYIYSDRFIIRAVQTAVQKSQCMLSVSWQMSLTLVCLAGLCMHAYGCNFEIAILIQSRMQLYWWWCIWSWMMHRNCKDHYTRFKLWQKKLFMLLQRAGWRQARIPGSLQTRSAILTHATYLECQYSHKQWQDSNIWDNVLQCIVTVSGSYCQYVSWSVKSTLTFGAILGMRENINIM